MLATGLKNALIQAFGRDCKLGSLVSLSCSAMAHEISDVIEAFHPQSLAISSPIPHHGHTTNAGLWDYLIPVLRTVNRLTRIKVWCKMPMSDWKCNVWTSAKMPREELWDMKAQSIFTVDVWRLRHRSRTGLITYND